MHKNSDAARWILCDTSYADMRISEKMEQPTFRSDQIVELATFGEEIVQISDDVTITYREPYQEPYQESIPQTPLTPLTPNSTAMFLTSDERLE
ncbi:14131_t:CDS:2 [Cetraspora pellucida]|uniref:14131_t:CDS:1 n=1 Tax=Cetraspora pellucida TaxID=1433469 RepID=A0ACA9KTH1_9GLOM|nr:14131_t:CDS:2 [Cetraspora pellucida]